MKAIIKGNLTLVYIQSHYTIQPSPRYLAINKRTVATFPEPINLLRWQWQAAVLVHCRKTLLHFLFQWLYCFHSEHLTHQLCNNITEHAKFIDDLQQDAVCYKRPRDHQYMKLITYRNSEPLLIMVVTNCVVTTYSPHYKKAYWVTTEAILWGNKYVNQLCVWSTQCVYTHSNTDSVWDTGAQWESFTKDA